MSSTDYRLIDTKLFIGYDIDRYFLNNFGRTSLIDTIKKEGAAFATGLVLQMLEKKLPTLIHPAVGFSVAFGTLVSAVAKAAEEAEQVEQLNSIIKNIENYGGGLLVQTYSCYWESGSGNQSTTFIKLKFSWAR